MSNFHVRQSLALFEEEFKQENVTPKRKKSNDPMKLISTRKWGVKKELQKLKTRQRKKTSTSSRSSLIEAYKTTKDADYTDDCLSILQRLSAEAGSTQTTKAAEAVVEREKCRLSKNMRIEKKPKDESTVFTDRDFDRFEEEDNFFS
ncbi:hypothetical protein CHS0354_028446 [Potamilus streckersoni]|uniref:40S ribosomal protein S19-binding protein 1 n=1 Tax=Potamilus streckersoni TaxID=2493646 RepID=A0AAE0SH49_9BIVA|nr:hypothetical protein CHS0354_028446 [Potamilus streckersoni]